MGLAYLPIYIWVLDDRGPTVGRHPLPVPASCPSTPSTRHSRQHGAYDPHTVEHGSYSPRHSLPRNARSTDIGANTTQLRFLLMFRPETRDRRPKHRASKAPKLLKSSGCPTGGSIEKASKAGSSLRLGHSGTVHGVQNSCVGRFGISVLTRTSCY